MLVWAAGLSIYVWNTAISYERVCNIQCLVPEFHAFNGLFFKLPLEEYQIWRVNVCMSLILHLSLSQKSLSRYSTIIFNITLAKPNSFFFYRQFYISCSLCHHLSPVHHFREKRDILNLSPFVTYISVSDLSFTLFWRTPFVWGFIASYVFQLNCLVIFEIFFSGEVIFSTPDFTDLSYSVAPQMAAFAQKS